VGVTTSISGNNLNQADFNANYESNVLDLTNSIFSTLKAAGVPVEGVTITSITWVGSLPATATAAAAQRRRLATAQVTFTVKTNTATAPLPSIAEAMSTALETGLAPALQSLPRGSMLSVVTGVAVENIASPTAPPTPEPTKSPTPPAADPVVGAVFAGVIVFAAVGYLAYNANWEEALNRVKHGKLGKFLKASKILNDGTGKVVPFEVLPEDDSTAPLTIDDSQLSFSLASTWGGTAKKKKKHHPDDGTFASSLSSWTRKSKVLPLDLEQSNREDDDELELLDLDSITSFDSSISSASLSTIKTLKKKIKKERKRLKKGAEGGREEESEGPETEDELDGDAFSVSLFGRDSPSAAESGRDSPASLSDGDSLSLGFSATGGEGSSSWRARKKPKMSKEERQKLIKQQQREKLKMRSKFGKVAPAPAPFPDLAFAIDVDYDSLDDGSISSGSTAVATTKSRRKPSPLLWRGGQVETPRRDRVGEDGSGADEGDEGDDEQEQQRQQELDIGLLRREERCIVEIAEPEPEEPEPKVPEPEPEPEVMAMPHGSPLRPLRGAVEEGQFERKKGSKHLSGARYVPSEYAELEHDLPGVDAKNEPQTPSSSSSIYGIATPVPVAPVAVAAAAVSSDGAQKRSTSRFIPPSVLQQQQALREAHAQAANAAKQQHN